jgi:Legume lectin domain
MAVAVDVQTLDQFGDPMPRGTGSPVVRLDGPGRMDSSSRYVAPQTGTGPVTIRASNGSVTGTAVVTLVDRPSETGVEYTRGFETSAGVVVNGSAVRDFQWIRLTDATPERGGSVFHADLLDVTGFATRFGFKLEEMATSPHFGAGVAFVIQGIGPTAVRRDGLGFGYQGIDRSVAVTFDPATNSIGLATNGGPPTGTVSLFGTGIELQSGRDVQADLYYDGGTLTVTLTDLGTGATAEAVAAFSVDIPDVVGGSMAYVGFTGATDETPDQFASQNVTGWRFRTVPPGSANQPPLFVRPARLTQSIFDPRFADLLVRAEDDGGPFNLRYRWELVSAPEGATPDLDPLGRRAVQLDRPGTYVFRLTVTDAQGLTATAEAMYIAAPA